ncbi:MAG: DMT family transporter [Granulosicoccus sp.]
MPELNGSTLRKPILMDYIRLLVASAIWGSSFLAIELALADFPPVAIASYRIIFAALLLLVICGWKGLGTTLDATKLTLFVAIGLLNSVVPFSLIGWGQLRIDSATTAILLTSSPFVTLLLSHFMTQDDRFAWNKLAGLVMGFGGVLVLLGQGINQGGGSFSGMLAVIVAAACYSLSSILIRRLGAMSSLVLVTGSLLAAALVMIPILLLFYPPWQQSYQSYSLAALAYLALGPTAIAYVLRAQIVQFNGAVFMSNVGYLIPLFAVLWGWLLLDQIPSTSMWVALAMVLTGIALGQRRKHT